MGRRGDPKLIKNHQNEGETCVSEAEWLEGYLVANTELRIPGDELSQPRTGPNKEQFSQSRTAKLEKPKGELGRNTVKR